MQEAVRLVGLYAGILALLGLFFALRVVMARAKKEIGLGDGGDRQMLVLIRVFGNFMEYVPLALVLILLTAVSGAPVWVVHALGIGLIVARILHGFGLSPDKPATFGRVVGALATWVVVAASAVWLIYVAVATGSAPA